MANPAPNALRAIDGAHPTGAAGNDTATPLGRSSLLADGAFVVAVGLGAIVGAEPLAAFLGLGMEHGALLAGAGAVFVAYGAGVAWVARRPSVPRWLVRAVLFANAVWVLGSVVVLTSRTPALSDGGRVTIAVLGLVVALFGASQWIALRQTR